MSLANIQSILIATKENIKSNIIEVKTRRRDRANVMDTHKKVKEGNKAV